MLTRLFLLMCLLSGQLSVFSQQMYFENISQNMNLPSQECYNILQDQKGYIWFGTEQGLCCYNGESLLVYNERNGLPEKSVYALEQDSSGNVWAVTSARRIVYIEHGVLKEAPFSESFKRLSDDKTTMSIAFVKGGDMYISLLENGTIKIDRQTGICTKLERVQHANEHYVNLVRDRLLPYDGTVYEKRDLRNGASLKLHYLLNGKEEKVISVSNEIADKRAAFLRTCQSKHTRYVTFHQYLVAIDASANYTICPLPSSILSVYVDRQGGLWVGTLLKGLYYFDKADIHVPPILSLADCSVSDVEQDDEGNIWCTSLEKGLFFCKNKEVLSHPFDNLRQNPEILTYQDSTVYVGWQKKLFAMKAHTVKQCPIEFRDMDYFTDLIFFNQHYYIGFHSFLFKTDRNFENIKYVRQFHKSYSMPASAKQLKVWDGQLYVMRSIVICKIKNDVTDYRRGKSPFMIGRCFEPLGRDTFLFGTQNGVQLHILEGDSDVVSNYIPGIKGPVSDMLTDRDGRVFATTKGEGLFVYTGDSMRSVNRLFKIPARVLFEIKQDVYGKYWISSSEGLFCCSWQGDTVSTIAYTTLDGLPANEIHKLAISPERVFFSSIYGVSSLPLEITRANSAEPKVYLSGLQIDNDTVNPGKLPHQLTYEQNTLRFSFDVISYKNKQHHIVYRLAGRDSTFLHANGSQLVMENLSPGEYELEVYAENEWGIRSSRPFRYVFRIDRPFWSTWWFITLMVVVLVLIFLITLRLFIRRAQTKAEERNRVNTMLAESQLTAIQAQMNPHFVFNAINSIQNYILKNQKEEAYHYLAKFSHLIRMVLNHSKKKMIPLVKELEMLNLYVELEQVRFKQAFDFEVQLPDYIDEHEVALPPMLIQPILENAIWHGLMPLKDRKGKLRLLFSAENNLFKIVIEDNGIGREQSLKAKMNVDHHSMALDLVKERIQMVKQLYQVMEDASIRIIDLFDEQQQAAGTRIEMYLPILET